MKVWKIAIGCGLLYGLWGIATTNYAAYSGNAPGAVPIAMFIGHFVVGALAGGLVGGIVLWMVKK